MDALSADAFKAYRSLVYDEPAFATFFRQMTPLSEIATLNIGSRPASRSKSNRIEDLRAIPWVFSWAQARVMLPGWYGVGTALSEFGDVALLREMRETWPFVRTTLDINAGIAAGLVLADVTLAVTITSMADGML